jgi:hypothetical protein
LHLSALRTERDANTDLPRTLRHAVGNRAVHPNYSEQQRHRARDRQHYQREGGRRHGCVEDVAHCAYVHEWQVRVDSPYCLPDFVKKRRGSRSWTADGIGHGPPDVCGVVVDALPQNGVVDDRRHRLTQATIVDVANHADDFPPLIRRRRATQALAQGLFRSSPFQARQVLRDQRDRPPLVDLGPGEIPSRHQRNMQGSEHTGRDKPALRAPRRFPLAENPALRHQQIRCDSSSHGKVTDICCGGYARQRREPIQDFLLSTRGAFRLPHGRFRDPDLERLYFAGAGESRVHVVQFLEGTNHQSGADEQHQRQGDLCHDQDSPGAQPFAASARPSRPGVQRCCQPWPGVPDYRNRTEQQT